MARLGDLMSCGSKVHPVSSTHHCVTDLVNYKMFENIKTSIS